MDVNGNEEAVQVAEVAKDPSSDLTPAGKNLCNILFGMLDSENKGTVQFESLFTMVNQLCGYEASDADKNKFIEKYAEGNSEAHAEIQLSQFEQIVKELVMSEEVKKSAEAIMPLVDKNGDGFIDQNDLQEVYEMLGLPEVDSMPLIQSFDEDADGRLNAQEFGNLIADSLKMLFSKSETDVPEVVEQVEEPL